MALPHADPGQVVDVRLPTTAAAENVTQTLIKTENLEVIRLILPAGKEISEHKVDKEITVQCLEGRIEFTARGKTQELRPGQMLYLAGGDSHSLKAPQASSVLVTILL